MSNILVLDSSLFPADISASRGVTAQLLAALQAKDPSAKIVRRDLAANQLPHASLDLLAGLTTPADKHTPAQSTAAALSNTLVTELFAADTIVIGVPMYNFGIPSTLKAWVDHIAVAGKTFSYTPEGPKGLVTGKRVYLVASRGGVYTSGPFAAYNHTDPYLLAALGFLGMTDVTVIDVEQQKMGPEAQAAGLAAANAKINAAVKETQAA